MEVATDVAQKSFDRVVAQPVQPRGTELDGPVPRPVRQHSTADSPTGFDDRDRVSGRLQSPRRGQAGDAGTHHDNVLAASQPVVEALGGQLTRLVGTVDGAGVGKTQGLAGEDDTVGDNGIGEVGAGGAAGSDGEGRIRAARPSVGPPSGDDGVARVGDAAGG